jgi:chemotaxis protein CheX
METQYLKPFVDGVTELLSTMLESSCDVTSIDSSLHADVSSTIRLDGVTSLQVALSFPRETATKMVAQLLALEPSDVDDGILGDGVGELTNIVAGLAKSRIPHDQGSLVLSLPSVVVSTDHELSLFRSDGAAHLRMSTLYGEFSMHVQLSGRD